MKTSDVLLKAGRILAQKDWCQREMAIDSAGNAVNPRSRDAVAFCVRGACEAAGAGEGGSAAESYSLLAAVTGVDLVAVEFNDRKDCTKSRAIAAIDAAYVVSLQIQGLEPEDVL